MLPRPDPVRRRRLDLLSWSKARSDPGNQLNYAHRTFSRASRVILLNNMNKSRLFLFCFLALIIAWPFDLAGGEDNGVHIAVEKGTLVDLSGGASIKILGKVKYVDDTMRKHEVAEFTGKGFQLTGDAVSLEKDFSICFWVKGLGNEAWPVLVGNRLWENINLGFTLGGHSKKILYSTGNRTRFLIPVNEAAMLFDDTWHHVALTYSLEEGSKIYLDSRYLGGSASLGSLKNKTLTFLSAPDENYGTSASLDDIRVVKRVLSLKEIAKINKNEPPKTDFNEQAPWPTWMYNKERLGQTPAPIQPKLEVAWSVKARFPPSAAWPDPAPRDFFNGRDVATPRSTYDRSYQLIAAEKNIYYGSSSDDSMTCRRASTGEVLWKFYAEGPIRLAPSWHNGKLYFGSDDGFIYCLEAKTGELVWKTQPVKSQKIPGNQRLISIFPIRSSILIHNEQGYFVSGFFPKQGVHYGAVNLKTGKVTGQTKINTVAQGYLKVIGSKVYTPQGRNGDTWLLDLQRRGTITVGQRVAITGAYPYSAVSNADYVVRGGNNKVAFFERASGKEVWSSAVEGRAYSVIIAYDSLYVSTDLGSLHCFSLKKAKRYKTGAFDKKAKIASSISSSSLKKIIDARANKRGYALFVGSENIKLAAELVMHSEMKAVICLKKTPTAEQRAGIVGLENRLHFHISTSKTLPYGPSIFNIVVAGESVSKKEVSRVLNPYDGNALHGSAVIAGQPPADAGEWTHFYGDIGNTASSEEKNIKSSDLVMQWFGEPGPAKMVDRHNRTTAPLYKDGVMLISGMNWFTAVDAHNGQVLWEKSIPNSVRPTASKSSGNMTLAGNNIYLVSGNKCLALNTRTGKQVHQYSLPEGSGDWCYVANHNGLLYGSDCPAGATRWEMTPKSWEIGYSGNKGNICSRSLFAYDLKTHKKKATYKPKKGVIVTQTICVNEGVMTFVENVAEDVLEKYKKTNGHLTLDSLIDSKGYLVGIDAITFKELWRTPLKLNMKTSFYSMAAEGKTVVYGTFFDTTKRDPFKTTGHDKHNRVVHYDEKTIINCAIYCFDNKTGKPVWERTIKPFEQVYNGGHGELTQHGCIIGNEMYLDHVALNLATGKNRPGWEWHRGGHGCGTFSASATHLFYRQGSHAMSSIKSPKTDQITNGTRPGCWIGMIPVGGLLLAPETSSGCSCGFAIQTSIAFRQK